LYPEPASLVKSSAKRSNGGILKPKTNKYKQISNLNPTNNRKRRKMEKETESLYTEQGVLEN